MGWARDQTLTILAVSILGHAVLIGAVAVIVATYTAAATRPKIFFSRSSRCPGGERAYLGCLLIHAVPPEIAGAVIPFIASVRKSDAAC